MQLLKSPNRWSCLPTSFAMALDTSLEAVLEAVGHDGSRVLWPDLDEPSRRQAFHVQELIEVAVALGYRATPIDGIPVSQACGRKHRPILPGGNAARFCRHLAGNPGVLIGETEDGVPHAAAWDGARLYDPRGFTSPGLAGLHARTFWRVEK